MERLCKLTSTKNDAGSLAGAKNEISEVASLRSQGKNVEYGGRQADVVDHTTQQAFQLKNVSSASDNAVRKNLTKAAEQLSGNTGEIPLEGYNKVAKIRMNPELATQNPLYNASRDEVKNLIQETLSEPNKKLKGKLLRDGVDEVRFVNGNGIEEIFKKSNGDF
jgi:hypothetical protein